MEKFIPSRPGLDLGVGFNSLNGEVRGVAVEGQIASSNLSGQIAQATARIVESQEQLLESLKVSVDAGGRYGLFSAEGRFGLAQQSSFTSQSTYVVAECVVENAFRSFSRPQLVEEAGKRLSEMGQEAFKTGYGDCFVRGVRSGGEFYAVFQLTSTTKQQEKEVAVSLQAEVQGILASGSLESSVQNLEQTKSKVSSMSVLFYQRAGKGDTIAPVSNPGEIASRLKEFPAIAQADPIGYLVQIVDYQVLALPPFDELGFRQREEALEDYLRLKMKYLGIRAEIQLVQQNPDLFESPPASGELSQAYDIYSQAVNYLNRHARKVANREIDPDLFVPKNYDPGLEYLPVFIFKKKAPSADLVQVPNLIGLGKDAAQALLTSLGLNPISNSIAVDAGSGQPTDTILRQTPGAGEHVPPGTSVVIDYNYVPSQRFNWLVETGVVRTLPRDSFLLKR